MGVWYDSSITHFFYCMDQQSKDHGSNPMGESKAGKKNVWPILGGILLVLFIGAALVCFLVFNAVKDAVQNGMDAANSETGDDGRITMEAARDAQVTVMLEQYAKVVNATSEDVSWEEYLIELDAFIVELEALYDIDPNPLLAEGLDDFRLAQTTYEEAVQLDDPAAPVDSVGVEKAGEYINTAQDSVNSYLNEIGYE